MSSTFVYYGTWFSFSFPKEVNVLSKEYTSLSYTTTQRTIHDGLISITSNLKILF